jgi:hypothetical protein
MVFALRYLRASGCPVSTFRKLIRVELYSDTAVDELVQQHLLESSNGVVPTTAVSRLANECCKFLRLRQPPLLEAAGPPRINWVAAGAVWPLQ